MYMLNVHAHHPCNTRLKAFGQQHPGMTLMGMGNISRSN